MAKRIITELIDDLDGADAAETVTFGVDGDAYHIDLSADNAKRLREFLGSFVAAGRRIPRMQSPYYRTPGPGRPSNGTVPGTVSSVRRVVIPEGIDARTAREWVQKYWAGKNGNPLVSERGRIPLAAVEAYRNRPLGSPKAEEPVLEPVEPEPAPEPTPEPTPEPVASKTKAPVKAAVKAPAAPPAPARPARKAAPAKAAKAVAAAPPPQRARRGSKATAGK